MCRKRSIENNYIQIGSHKVKKEMSLFNYAFVFLFMIMACHKKHEKPSFLLIAHRGGVVNDTLSENSLKGLEEAIKRGYTHIELDVRVTKDGHAVCFHDKNLMREAGINKDISDLTLNELRVMKLTRSQEIIPTFDEYCARCAGRINVMIDTKSGDVQNIEQYIGDTETALVKYGLLKDALFIIDRVPTCNQQKVAYWFLGKAKVSWRVDLKKAKILLNTMPENPGQYYFIFNSPINFTKEDIDGFHRMGLMVIPSINKDHYKAGDPLTQGLADVQEMLDWGVDGLQIDSCYDPLVFAWMK